MLTLSDHMEAPDVLRKAGVMHATKAEMEERIITERQQEELDRINREMADWKQQREDEIER